MISKIFNEITFSFILIILGILFLDPFMIAMPDSVFYILVVVIGIVFCFFAGFIWKENPSDEREEQHVLFAGRAGYLLGSTVILLGILWQGLVDHSVDPWLIISFIALVLGKLIGRYYARLHQ